LPLSEPGQTLQSLLAVATRLAEAAESGDADLIVGLVADQDALFERLKAEPAAELAPSEIERLQGLVDRSAALLAEKVQAAAAEIEAVHEWRRCLSGYRSRAPVAARFVDRKG